MQRYAFAFISNDFFVIQMNQNQILVVRWTYQSREITLYNCRKIDIEISFFLCIPFSLQGQREFLTSQLLLRAQDTLSKRWRLVFGASQNSIYNISHIQHQDKEKLLTFLIFVPQILKLPTGSPDPPFTLSSCFVAIR